MTFAVNYCSHENVLTVLSFEGIKFASDDDRTGILSADEQNFLQECIEWTQSKINYFISLRYDLSTVPGNTWIKWCNALMAACQMLRRRGDTPSKGLIDQEEQYLFWLEQIRTSDGLIPQDGSDDAKLLASSAGMSMSNLRIDHRFRVAKTRYVPRISTLPNGFPAGYPRFADNSSIMSQ